MIASLLSLSSLSAIAHRGGSKVRPENTLAAFDHAVSLGVDAIECDVHLSRDGEVVVIHDATLDRTTDAKGPVLNLTAAQLARVDAGFHFVSGSEYPYRDRGVGVPTLHELLTRYPETPTILEIKGADPRVAQGALSVIREHDAAGRMIVGGFSHAVLETVRRALPDLPTSASSPEARQALTRSYFRLAPKAPAFRLFQMPFRLRGRRMFRRSFVTAARRAKIPVQAWIVDEPQEMRLLIDWGVTGIISDRPDVAVEIVKAEGTRQKA